MSRYSLKVFYNSDQIERFDHRSALKLKSILLHPRYHRAGELSPFGELEKHPNGFEVFDSAMEKLFHGNISETISFIRKLK